MKVKRVILNCVLENGDYDRLHSDLEKLSILPTEIESHDERIIRADGTYPGGLDYTVYDSNSKKHEQAKPRKYSREDLANL